MTPIVDAATVIVLRPGPDGFETLMLRRHHGHDFMANVWVFPGGGVDDADREYRAPDSITDLSPQKAARRLGIDAPKKALALYLAAIRETFEEAGLLLARRREISAPISFADDEVRNQFEELRGEVDAGELDFLTMARDHELILSADALGYLARWITPHFENRRYDTRFFVAHAPPAQTASHDARETTGGRWWTPQQAIDRYRSEDIDLAPPTLRILEELREFPSVSELLSSLRHRRLPPAILPALGADDSRDGPEVTLLLPGDPEYPSDDPRFEVADPVQDAVTRIVRRDGQWHSVCDLD